MTVHQEALLGDDYIDRPVLRDDFLIVGPPTDFVITAFGVPAPQGSMTRNTHGAVYADNAKTLKPWRSIVTTAVREAIEFEHGTDAELPIHPRGSAVAVRACFTFTRPANHFGTGRNALVLKDSAPKWHVVKPDSDKLVRAILDSLKDAGLLGDDCQVVLERGVKTYVTPHHTSPDALQIPGAVIRVRGL